MIAALSKWLAHSRQVAYSPSDPRLCYDSWPAAVTRVPAAQRGSPTWISMVMVSRAR